VFGGKKLGKSIQGHFITAIREAFSLQGSAAEGRKSPAISLDCKRELRMDLRGVCSSIRQKRGLGGGGMPLVQGGGENPCS